MDPFSISERVDVASVPHLPSAPTPSLYAQAMATPRPSPADPRLVAQLESLAARVDLLERRLKSLGQCAVQQFWDGRIHLPAAAAFKVVIGQSHLVMDGGKFNVVINGKTIVSAAGLAGAAAPSSPTGSSQGSSLLGGANQSNSSWKDVAQANGIESQRSAGPGINLSSGS